MAEKGPSGPSPSKASTPCGHPRTTASNVPLGSSTVRCTFSPRPGAIRAVEELDGAAARGGARGTASSCDVGGHARFEAGWLGSSDPCRGRRRAEPDAGLDRTAGTFGRFELRSTFDGGARDDSVSVGGGPSIARNRWQALQMGAAVFTVCDEGSARPWQSPHTTASGWGVSSCGISSTNVARFDCTRFHLQLGQLHRGSVAGQPAARATSGGGSSRCN